MAMMIRNEHELLSLSVALEVGSTSMIRFDMWRGRSSLGTEHATVADVGLPEVPSFEAYRRARFALPAGVREWIQTRWQAERRDAHEPLWLQLRQSSGHLAVVPWEALLNDLVDAPILRIPNFAVAPRFLSGDLLRLVVCASAPSAKTPFPLPPFVADLVGMLQGSGIPRTQVHIFADLEAYRQLLPIAATSTNDHSVIVHDPHFAESFGLGATGGGEALATAAVTSPWLRWIRGMLRSAPVDAVHFACPGFFSDAYGALALARSPVINTDVGSSHFIGARELASFLNSIGALSVGFSQPNETVWNLGLRLLADQVAQLRPGPVLLHTDPSTDAPIARVYGFLFALAAQAAPQIRNLALYVHPKRLDRFTTSEGAFETSEPKLGTFAVESESPLAHYARSASPRESVEPDEQLWERAVKLEVDQAIAEVAASGSGQAHRAAAQAGASRAVELIQSLLRDGKVG